MCVAFLSPDQGSATSAFAATKPLPLPADDGTPPYFSPYYVPALGKWTCSLPCELAGPFVGPRLAPQRLPTNPAAKARELWRLSEETIAKIERKAAAHLASVGGELEDEILGGGSGDDQALIS